MEVRPMPALFSCIIIFSLIVGAARGDSSVTDEQPTEESQVVIDEEGNPSNSAELQDENPTIPRELFHLGPKIADWDGQRAKWLQENPHMRLNRKDRPRMILVTSSQSETCQSRSGDHYLLKAAKNKIDYARLHDIQIYYNMVIMNPLMTSFFVKLPLVRKLMLTHPEAEWIWWMDSDAIITDMSFEIPLQRYKDHNMIVHGWDTEIYEKKSWIGLNAGIFLIRNCQWSLDMLDTWGAMGEDYGDHKQAMGTLASQKLNGRPEFDIDDQSALVYLLSTSHTDELKAKVFIESSYSLHGYWVWAMEKLDSMLKDPPPRDAENSEEYWTFITHFVGCKTCTGGYASYDLDLCLAEMERAFNLADNQVMHLYGFQHDNLTSPAVHRTRRDWTRPLAYLRKSSLDFLRQNPWSTRTATPNPIKKVRINQPSAAGR